MSKVLVSGVRRIRRRLRCRGAASARTPGRRDRQPVQVRACREVVRRRPPVPFVEGDARDVGLMTALLGRLRPLHRRRGHDRRHLVLPRVRLRPVGHQRAHHRRVVRRRHRGPRTGQLQKVTYLSSSMVFESTRAWPSFEGQEQEYPRHFRPTGSRSWPWSTSPGRPVTSTDCRTPSSDPSTASASASGGPWATSRSCRERQAGDEPCRARSRPEGPEGPRSAAHPGRRRQVRHYTYGGDLARGIVDAMEHPPAENEDFNLSTATSTTVLELAQLIWRKIKARRPFRFVTGRALRARRRPSGASTDKAKPCWASRPHDPRRDARRGDPVDRAGDQRRSALSGSTPLTTDSTASAQSPSGGAGTEGAAAAEGPAVSAVGQGGAGRRDRLLELATPAHYLSLVAGFVLLLLLTRHLWFIGDIFDFFGRMQASTCWVLGPARTPVCGGLSAFSLMVPHDEHWSTIPMLLTFAIYQFVGLHSYLPYIGADILAHLLVVHLLWRWMRRLGVDPWVVDSARWPSSCSSGWVRRTSSGRSKSPGSSHSPWVWPGLYLLDFEGPDRWDPRRRLLASRRRRADVLRHRCLHAAGRRGRRPPAPRVAGVAARRRGPRRRLPRLASVGRNCLPGPELSTTPAGKSLLFLCA